MAEQARALGAVPRAIPRALPQQNDAWYLLNA